MQGIDYAWGRPRPSAIAAAGFGFVCRYLSRDPKKSINAVEAKALIDAGLDVVVVWETTATRPKGGAAAGDADGTEARRQTDAVGLPAAAAVYFAVDFDARTADLNSVAAYGRAFGARVAPHPVGVYGSLSVCDAMLRNGVARYAWQTVAWSHGQRLASAHLYQRLGQKTIDGVACDVNDALQPDYGGWRALPGARPPAQLPSHQEDDVTIDEFAQAFGIPKTLDGSRYLTLDEIVGFRIEKECADGGAIDKAIDAAADNVNSHFSKLPGYPTH